MRVDETLLYLHTSQNALDLRAYLFPFLYINWMKLSTH